MDELSQFYQDLKSIVPSNSDLTIEQARVVVKKINEFLFCHDSSLGATTALGGAIEYFSAFHKYWETHHKEILNCQIDEAKCEMVADALHSVFVQTKGNAFQDIYDTDGLSKESICQVRMLTANQDFRGSREFKDFAKRYQEEPELFNPNIIVKDPESFVKGIGITNLSQNDKRVQYAEKIAEFVLSYNCTPFQIIEKFGNDVSKFRKALIDNKGAGYGNKKTDMFIRDMVVLGVWQNVTGFEAIDVASDINTIKVALRTGIISTSIPLVSSFLDIFCHQYSYIDEMSAKAWRMVWEKWRQKYPNETLTSPCLIDYFVYKVVGKQFCKEILYYYHCSNCNRIFPSTSMIQKWCKLCVKEGKSFDQLEKVSRVLPCNSADGHIAILNTAYVKSLDDEQKMTECPFTKICNGNKHLLPPKSISILGQTGWSTAYVDKDCGGGGLMA